MERDVAERDVLRTTSNAIGTCPADTTTACTMDTTCVKPDGNACRCTNCAPTAPICFATSTWYCPSPVTIAGCPPSQPNFGAACNAEGVDCAYFSFECGVPNRVCSRSIWTPRANDRMSDVFPPREEEDIRYLSGDDIATMASRRYDFDSPPTSTRRPRTPAAVISASSSRTVQTFRQSTATETWSISTATRACFSPQPKRSSDRSRPSQNRSSLSAEP